MWRAQLLVMTNPSGENSHSPKTTDAQDQTDNQACQNAETFIGFPACLQTANKWSGESNQAHQFGECHMSPNFPKLPAALRFGKSEDGSCGR